MLIPLRTDSPLRHTPYVNWGLIIVNFAVFFLQLAYNAGSPDEASFIAPLVLHAYDPRIWQYVTYAFLHAGWLHIIGNMLFLYIFGNNINDRLGNIGYLAFYLSGAIIAGVGYVLVDRQGTVLGASGAIAAVTGAYLILLPRTNITIVYFIFFIGVIEIPSLWFILFFFLTDVLGEVAPQYIGGEAAVAHMAHISGTLFGILVCIGLLATRLLPRDPFDVLAMIRRWNQRRQYRDMVNRGFDPFGAGAGARGGGGWISRGAQRTPEPVAQDVLDLRERISQAASRHDLASAAQLYQELLLRDPAQILARPVQLDVSNHLAAQHLYPQAAAAYELFAKAYPNYEQIEQVYLMLGMIYSRYLAQPGRAKENLLKAIARMHFSDDIEMAKAELAQVEAALGAQS